MPLKIRKPNLTPKRGLSIYLLCLCIALFSWGILKLSREYHIQITFKIHYFNVPNNYLINPNSDSVVTIKLKAKGFNILSNSKNLENKTIEIDASNLSKTGSYQSIYSSQKILEALKIQKHISEIETISSDSIKLFFNPLTKKKVPVYSLISYSTKRQYFVSDSIFFTPDSVWVYGSASDLSKIHSANTKTTHLSELNHLYIGQFALQIPSINHQSIKIIPNKITYFIPVERYTEATINCKINKKTNSGELEVKTFPNSVAISYYVAISKYKNISDTNFSVSVDLSKQVGANKATIQVDKKPKNIKIIKINPAVVEFLNIKK